MVLSNKKLKQKLREELAKSSANKHTDDKNSSSCENVTEPEVNSQSETLASFKYLLESSTRRSRLSKREKRRGQGSSRGSEPLAAAAEYGGDGGHADGNDGKQNKGAEEKEENSHGLEGSGGKGKKKKQKRKMTEEEVVGEGGLGSKESGVLVNGEETEKKDQKNGKKKRKNKKQGEKEDMLKSAADKGSELRAEEGIEKERESNKDSTGQDSSYVPTKVYVGGIPYYSTEDDIRSYFEGCGTITEVDCMMFPETGNFRGIAIIRFKTEAAAKRALALDGADMGGRFLKIQPYKARRASKASDFAPEILEGYNRVYVGNLSWDITEDELKSFFSGCSILSVRFGMDKETGNFKGFAHVDFSDNESMTKALKLDQKLLSGRNVVIRCAVPLKKANANASSLPLNGAANDDQPSSVSGKARRRTCFLCKKKGHESSNCPLAESVAVPPKEEASSDKMASVSGKVRRRTCLLCRQKGHESSTCPTREENS